MGMFDGKKGLVLGVANNRSIAWAIAKTIMDEGGEVGFTHLPDPPGDEKCKNRRRVIKCTDQYPEKTKFVVPLNVQDDENIAEVMKTAEAEFGKIDFLLHSIAYADREDLSRDTIETSRDGFKMAMATLDIFRSTVGAAALGFARHAMHEALNRTKSRQMFGAPMSRLQLIQAKLGEMSLDIDASSLLIYRAAWTKDNGAERITKEAAMAKLFATEAAQRVIDEAVQIFGGSGVVSGFAVEQLYREIRALRIYEGASEVQKLIIASQTLKEN